MIRIKKEKKKVTVYVCTIGRRQSINIQARGEFLELARLLQLGEGGLVGETLVVLLMQLSPQLALKVKRLAARSRALLPRVAGRHQGRRILLLVHFLVVGGRWTEVGGRERRRHPR